MKRLALAAILALLAATPALAEWPSHTPKRCECPCAVHSTVPETYRSTLPSPRMYARTPPYVSRRPQGPYLWSKFSNKLGNQTDTHHRVRSLNK